MATKNAKRNKRKKYWRRRIRSNDMSLIHVTFPKRISIVFFVFFTIHTNFLPVRGLTVAGLTMTGITIAGLMMGAPTIKG